MIIEHQELAALKAVFDEVTSQPWFNAADRNRFAQYLIANYPDGEFDAVEQRAAIVNVAKKFYSRAA